MSIFTTIGNLFKGLFDAAKKSYGKLSDDQKNALQQGTGIVDIINNNLEHTPNEIRKLIQEKFPALDETALENALFSVAKQFGWTQVKDFDEAVRAIQTKLNSLDGKEWALASHAAASVLSVLFAPPETKVAAIVSLIEWVYQHFIKKSTE